MHELLRQHGGSGGAVAAIEAQLLCHIQPWLGGDELTRLSLGLEVVASLVAHADKEHAKKYVAAVLGHHAEAVEGGAAHSAPAST